MARATLSSLVAVSAASLVLAGCGVGSMFGGSDDASYANITPSQSQVAQAASGAKPAIAQDCPAAQIRPGSGFHQNYAAGGPGQPGALRFQGLIDSVTRDCATSNGQIVITMGATGHVLMGASGADGPVTLPLRFSVQRDGLLVFSERYDVSVNLAASGRNEFTYGVENVAIPYVGGETITIWVGFDN